MSREEYLGEDGKFKKGNPGYGRPKDLKLSDIEPIVEDQYQRLVARACELSKVGNWEDLSPYVQEMLDNWKTAKMVVEMIKKQRKKMSTSDQKMLKSYLQMSNQCLTYALDAAKKEKAMEDKGKGGKKPTGMY